MKYLQHNTDTSLNIFAKLLGDKIAEPFTYRNIPDFDRVSSQDFVQIVDGSMKDDLESLVSRIDNDGSAIDFLPKVLIAQSLEVDYSAAVTMNALNRRESITLTRVDDPADGVMLDGTTFEFQTRVQVLVLAGSGFVSKELSLELVRVLYELRTISYPLRMFDDQLPNVFYQVDNFGSIDLMGVETGKMQSQIIGSDSSIMVTGLEFDMRESYFRLSDADVYRQYEISPKAVVS